MANLRRGLHIVRGLTDGFYLGKVFKTDGVTPVHIMEIRRTKMAVVIDPQEVQAVSILIQQGELPFSGKRK